MNTLGISMKTLAELEREHIEAALALTDGNRSRAAILLGITFYSLARRLKKFGFPSGRSGKPKTKKPEAEGGNAA